MGHTIRMLLPLIVMIVFANPMDVMCHAAMRSSGLR